MPPRTSRPSRLKSPDALSETVTPLATPQKSLWLVVFVLTMLLLVALSVAGYFYYQYRHSAEKADAKEIEDLAKEIGSMMLLPEGEAPTLATVTDKDKLSDQPFFQKSENGDKVLIYSNSGRAILYRPSLKKIVDVTTVNINTPSTSTPTQEEPVNTSVAEVVDEAVPAIIRVALLNGSKTVGITNTKEKQLTAVLKNIAIVTKDAAKKDDYTQTIVVDVTGKNIEISQQIADTLGGIVAGLPNGEVAPTDAEVLVIVGGQ
ncbi:MAG: hypothetical protein KBA91_03165 [Candidatus Moranbacteria bacterium]|nr:hypothetical protein [Candidatus Moranbacteria bacterium]